MSVLLTGASGLLGANLAHLLHERGAHPRLLLRERSDRRGLRGLSYEEARGELLDPASLDEAMRGVTHVYHVAGLVQLDPFAFRALHRINVEGTRNVLEAARRAGVRRLVHVSSASTVGSGSLSAPATEESSYTSEGFEPYPESKREAEALAMAAEGLEVVVANPTLSIGPYDSRPSSGELLLQVARGLAAFYPSGGTNFVNAQDVAEGLVLLMEKGRPRERYLLGGQNLTWRQFLEECAEEAGVPPPRLPLPEGLTRGLGWAGDRLGRLAPALFKHVNTPILQTLFRTAYSSSDKAFRELGYRPHPIRVGIRDAYRWFQEEGMLPRDRPLSPRGRVDARD